MVNYLSIILVGNHTDMYDGQQKCFRTKKFPGVAVADYQGHQNWK